MLFNVIINMGDKTILAQQKFLSEIFAELPILPRTTSGFRADPYRAMLWYEVTFCIFPPEEDPPSEESFEFITSQIPRGRK